MAEELSYAMGQLSLNSQNLDPSSVEARLIDEQSGSFQPAKPRKQTRQTSEDLLKELEEDFLTPSATFSPKWLNQFQK